jgi:tetratricopeptide (TPR) repeat protein
LVTAARDFRKAALDDAMGPEPFVGMGRALLLQGSAEAALGCARDALRVQPDFVPAVALAVRSLIRLRQFDAALLESRMAVKDLDPDPELLAAHASALYRVQRNEEAAAVYREVLVLDPWNEEAHVRLGSGLSAPRRIEVGPKLRAAVTALRSGEDARALRLLREELAAAPGHPVAHRLVGETLFRQRSQRSVLRHLGHFERAWRLSTPPAIAESLEADFVGGVSTLSPTRRAVVSRVLGTFGSRLPAILTKGGRHDLLLEEERTTDAPARASLRGKRTFDGRVWDDVRGIGGLRAATGIEALDEAAEFGFDTFAHEVAHQVHLHALREDPAFARIKELFVVAEREGRMLDYYAASNWAEYFGQGVEAFLSLVKRPTLEATHGHTRFELMRLDPSLHELIASLVDYDPLGADRPPSERDALLTECIEAALVFGRVDDVRTAAERLGSPEAKRAALARAAAVESILLGH